MDNLNVEKVKGAFICSRARWLQKCEKNTSCFFSLEKQRQTRKKIIKPLINNISTDNQEQINEDIRLFYYNLYTSEITIDDCQTFFEKNEGL